MTVLFKPILALHIINFSSCRNYWGGGGQNDMFPSPPQYFHGGLSPPKIDASAGIQSSSLLIDVQESQWYIWDDQHVCEEMAVQYPEPFACIPGKCTAPP